MFDAKEIIYREEISLITSMFNLETNEHLKLLPYINYILDADKEVNFAVVKHIYNELLSQIRSNHTSIEIMVKNNLEFIEYTKKALLRKTTNTDEFFYFYGFMFESYNLIECINTEDTIKNQMITYLEEIKTNLTKRENSCPFKEYGLSLVNSDLSNRFNLPTNNEEK